MVTARPTVHISAGRQGEGRLGVRGLISANTLLLTDKSGQSAAEIKRPVFKASINITPKQTLTHSRQITHNCC